MFLSSAQHQLKSAEGRRIKWNCGMFPYSAADVLTHAGCKWTLRPSRCPKERTWSEKLQDPLGTLPPHSSRSSCTPGRFRPCLQKEGKQTTALCSRPKNSSSLEMKEGRHLIICPPRSALSTERQQLSKGFQVGVLTRPTCWQGPNMALLYAKQCSVMEP